MASIKQANRKLYEQLKNDKHFEHAVLANPRVRDFLLNRFGFDIYQMPMCGKCERIGFWHKQDGVRGGYCPRCGTFTANPLTAGQFYEQGLHVDRTVHPGAPVMVDRKLADPNRVVTVYGGEADLPDKDKEYKAVIPDKKE